MPKKKDLTGIKFGMLLVLTQHDQTVNRKYRWLCRCDCGEETIVIGGDMSSGRQVSCGCFRDANTSTRQIERYKDSHRLSHTPIGVTWRNMMNRCTDSNNIEYHNYGGRGIRICSALSESPKGLKDLLGERPEGLTLDRVDTNGNYSCGRCPECTSLSWPMNLRWATRKEQMRNVRYNHLIEINGKTKCIAEWEEAAGLVRGMIKQRLERGWSGERLLSPPDNRFLGEARLVELGRSL